MDYWLSNVDNGIVNLGIQRLRKLLFVARRAFVVRKYEQFVLVFLGNIAIN